MDEEQNEKKFNSAVFFLINKPLRWTEYLKQKYGKEYFKLITVYRVICDLAWHKKVDIPAGQPLITTYRELGCILALSPSKIKNIWKN